MRVVTEDLGHLTHHATNEENFAVEGRIDIQQVGAMGFDSMGRRLVSLDVRTTDGKSIHLYLPPDAVKAIMAEWIEED